MLFESFESCLFPQLLFENIKGLRCASCFVRDNCHFLFSPRVLTTILSEKSVVVVTQSSLAKCQSCEDLLLKCNHKIALAQFLGTLNFWVKGELLLHF